ncbi:ABC transporter ATP-binding protein [Streptomyces sp. NPDC005402]|uniref:ABC transporter ATP-binding protein n=1 Tax=Streptomyces sp. NPDC005402 TaxID=3155338 RepID=UPI0033A29DB4
MRSAAPGRVAVLRHSVRLNWQASPRMALLIVLLVVLESAAVGLIAVSSRWLVDEAGLGSTTGLLSAAALAAVAHTVATTGQRVEDSLALELINRVDVLINEEILGTVAGLSGIAHVEQPDYLDRLFLLRQGSRTLATAVWSLAVSAAGTVGVGLSLWLLVGVHPGLGLLAPLALLPLWINSRAHGRLRLAEHAAARHRRREEALHRLCVDAASAKELHISGAHDVIDADAEATWQHCTSLVTRARVAGSCWNLLGWCCFGAGYLAALTFTAHLAGQGRASLGDVVLVLVIGTRLRGQIQQTVEQLGKVIQTGQVTEHYLWLRRYASEHGREGSGAPPQGGAVHLDNVTFRYPGAAQPTLRNIDLRLAPGSVVALVGVNGAGKTTLVKLLTGMYQPTSGTITVNGTDLSTIDPSAWLRRVTAAFQDFVKFQLPVRQAVGIGDLDRADRADAVHAAVAAAGADEFVARLPQGIDTQLGPLYDGADLSQGQWQRLALARALMRTAPDLLILDEPTAALDPAAEHDLYERYTHSGRARPDGITLLVTHRFSTVRLADHIVVLADGQIAEQGDHDTLTALGGHYARLYAAQAGSYRSAPAASGD